ncbi:interferon regulatory factor 2 isoform X1 [Nerophis lumbriciformis]|uniref:interferon regulatory factor 2 isoform X1 n=1 Tax=Nerophis lumbriciformis TaxID=546530 RepID=UPI002AE04DE9|nr:interferon regulatory factor 2-like isoform X1 [Nerophis lumbriciformis]
MPVDRMRMRPWLEEQINSCQIPGLKWVNKEKRIFQIPWMHAARHGWDLEKDAPLFMRWAIHTGKKKIDKEGRPKGNKETVSKSCGTTLLHIKEEPQDEVKIPDTTRAIPSFTEDHLMASEQLPFVCQTIEVTTENEEETVSSSHSYPLQISPSASDTDSDVEDTEQGVSASWRRDLGRSVLKVSPYPLPGMATFVRGSKNFRVTTTRDPNPLISYHSDGWTKPYSQNSLTSSIPNHTHEMRASVIMKTSDVTYS